MIAGTGIESAHETLRLTEYAAGLGYDAAMVRTPHYYKKQMSPANLLAFYRTVADRSPLPIIIYNFPQATGYDIPAEVVIELANHPNMLAIKESSGNLDKVKADGRGHAPGEAANHRDGNVRSRDAADDQSRDCRKRKAEQGTGERRLASGNRRSNGETGVLARPRCSCCKTVIVCRNRRRQIEDAAERSRLPGHGRRRAPA